MTVDVQKDSVLVFDTETTGLEESDQLIQLSWGWWDGAEGVNSPQSITCMPTIEWQSDWHDEHNLSMNDIKGNPQLSLAMIQPFVDALEHAAYIIGYNVKFDVNVLAKTLRRLHIDTSIIQSKTQIDPLTIWARSEPNKRLETAFRRWKGQELEGAHDATVDVKATASILPGMLKDFGLNNLELEQLARYCEDAKYVDAEGRMRWENGIPTLNFGKHEGKPVFGFTWSKDGDWYARNYHDFARKGFTMYPEVLKAFNLALRHGNDEEGFNASMVENFGKPPLQK